MSIPAYVIKEVPGVVVGLVVGAFIPSPLRLLKTLLVKQARWVIAKFDTEAKVIVADVEKKV
jgi:hypothetical protein